jgi:protein SCO1
MKFTVSKRLLSIAIIALSLGLLVSYQMNRGSKSVDMTSFNGTWLSQARDVSAFDLMGTAGKFNNAQLKDHWTMMFFGFTTCPSICPTTMVELSQMMSLLEHQHVKPLPQVVMVSLDPEHDTVEKLQHYVTAFHPQFLGASGVNEQGVKLFAKELGVAYSKTVTIDSKGRPHDNIEHTGTVMLFNPEGKLAAFFTMPHHARMLAKDYQLAIRAKYRNIVIPQPLSQPTNLD